MAATDDLYAADPGGARLAVGALQVLVGAFTPLALVSIAGVGIYAAPVLLPLLWVTANACRGGGRWYFTILAALVAAEAAWAISWSLMPDLQLPLPLVAAAATGYVFVKTWHKQMRAGTTLVLLFALGAFGLAGIGALAGADTTSREIDIRPQGS